MADKSAVGRRSKRKGDVGERQLAATLTEAGFECRRGYQKNGKDVADVIGLPHIHIECKRVEKLNLLKALQQAERDADPLELPAVFHRRNREPWMVTMRMETWLMMYRLFLEGLEDDKR